MKKVLALFCVAGMSLSAFAATDMATLNDRLEKSRIIIDELSRTPDKGIPDGIVKQATCVAVVPSLKKAAFVIGGQYGQGVVTCRTSHGWSAPAFIRMAGGSFGFQIGGQGTDLVLVAINDHGLQDLLKNKFKIGADAAAAAGPVGRNSQASTDWKLNSELLTYSRSKGLFAGIDLDGTSVSQNTDDTDTFYGSPHPFEQILKGNVLPPDSARPFLRTVAKYFHSVQD
ncbi:lipid-binding SYLF domain-containing protein [Silvibacterium bohemicum]|uniref:Lipid-binding SYLF domain-containing protein n=1 Tax=Silvibacterium bohemicum TaxID=1577686 RepID=A0A841K181_9BACT|nr:lipid-binding SYLF domain-containing protein [Silvibacterium bohemicum]MBB6143994.1 lipid-binding SYLF domain-containing protein [Silvibacterium bohemicum]